MEDRWLGSNEIPNENPRVAYNAMPRFMVVEGSVPRAELGREEVLRAHMLQCDGYQ